MKNYPDMISFKAIAGTTSRIACAALRAGQSPAEWLRTVVRRALNYSERVAKKKSA